MNGMGAPDVPGEDGLADEPELAAVDGSLAAERTSLAWDRTSLSLLACGAAVIKGVPVGEGVEARPGVGVAIVALAAATWLLNLRNEHSRRSAIGRGDLAAEASSLRRMAVSTTLVAVVALVLATAG